MAVRDEVLVLAVKPQLIVPVSVPLEPEVIESQLLSDITAAVHGIAPVPVLDTLNVVISDALVTFRLTGETERTQFSSVAFWNTALTVDFEFTIMAQVFSDPLQSPSHRLNMAPEAGTAVKMTKPPRSKLPEHVVPHDMPEGLLFTKPLPVVETASEPMRLVESVQVRWLLSGLLSVGVIGVTTARKLYAPSVSGVKIPLNFASSNGPSTKSCSAFFCPRSFCSGNKTGIQNFYQNIFDRMRNYFDDRGRRIGTYFL